MAAVNVAPPDPRARSSIGYPLDINNQAVCHNLVMENNQQNNQRDQLLLVGRGLVYRNGELVKIDGAQLTPDSEEVLQFLQPVRLRDQIELPESEQGRKQALEEAFLMEMQTILGPDVQIMARRRGRGRRLPRGRQPGGGQLANVLDEDRAFELINRLHPQLDRDAHGEDQEPQQEEEEGEGLDDEQYLQALEEDQPRLREQQPPDQQFPGPDGANAPAQRRCTSPPSSLQPRPPP